MDEEQINMMIRTSELTVNTLVLIRDADFSKQISSTLQELIKVHEENIHFLLRVSENKRLST